MRVDSIARVEPYIKVVDIAHVTFERKSVEQMTEFLLDFGFVEVEGKSSDSSFFRANGNIPYSVEIIPSERDHFVGAGFVAESMNDLEQLSLIHNVPVVQSNKPGGGYSITLSDPDGIQVNVLFGFEEATPIYSRSELFKTNTPFDRSRVNEPVRSEVEPTAICRLGHLVLFTPDFDRAINWYMTNLGFLPSDVATESEGKPVLAFMRFNRGQIPTDHHSLAIVASDQSGIHHVSTEAIDLEAVAQGQRYLKESGWEHFWGIGRHKLGSQVFDYWLDPVGVEWEHYADGDSMTEEFETGYCLVSRQDLWTWGDDLPEVTKPTAEAIQQAKGRHKSMLIEWDKPPRPWIK